MKDVQCYELFGGIALKNHAFSFSYICVCVCVHYVCIENLLPVQLMCTAVVMAANWLLWLIYRMVYVHV